MMTKRVAALLLVFAIICPPQVAVHGHCTRAQKEAIIIHCASYIHRDKPTDAPQPWSRCCRTVREVPGMDMDCIVKLLKLVEQEAFGKRIRDLEVLCVVYSPPPSPHHNHQVISINSLSISYFTYYPAFNPLISSNMNWSCFCCQVVVQTDAAFIPDGV